MTRHLVAIPGGAHTLPTGTVKHLSACRDGIRSALHTARSMWLLAGESDPFAEAS